MKPERGKYWRRLAWCIGIGLPLFIAWWLSDRLPFYLRVKDAAVIEVARTFDVDHDSGRPRSNVDFDFLALHVELTPQTTFKNQKPGVLVINGDRKLSILPPEVLAEWNASTEPDIETYDELIRREGSCAAVDRAMYRARVGLEVLFSLPAEFRRTRLLFTMKAVHLMLPPGELEYFTADDHDAILKVHAVIKVAELTWSTKHGEGKDQRRGIVQFFGKNIPQDHAWVTDVARSLIVHRDGEIISAEEMLRRLEDARDRTGK